MPENIFVHIDLAGKTHFVGRLWLHDRHGRESASFEYTREWKSTPVCIPLEPTLIGRTDKIYPLKSGAHQP